MTKDEEQHSPLALPFGCELRAERLRAMSLSNGRWTFYEAVKRAVELFLSISILKSIFI